MRDRADKLRDRGRKIMKTLGEMADVLRSKNAGPFNVTFDIMFKHRDVYERVLRSGALVPDKIAALYGLSADRVMVMPYDIANSIKVTMPRKHPSGDIEDDDIYGCQQHLPLAGLPIPDGTAPEKTGDCVYPVIGAALMEKVVYETIKKGATRLPKDVRAFFEQAIARETSPSSRGSFRNTLKSIDISEATDKPTCPDTGWPLFFFKVGNQARLEGGFMALEEITRRMVARATREGFLRNTMKHPLTGHDPGTNVGMNIPAFEWKFVPGGDLQVSYVAKGGGSECFGGTRYRMIAFADGVAGIYKFVVDSYVASTRAGAICPPSILGIGIGGTANVAANLAKQAACLRPVGSRHPEPMIAQMEESLYAALNTLGIGAMGAGGDVSVMSVNIEYAYTHIAGIAVATSSNCWIARRCTHKISAANGRVEELEDPDWFERSA